jgi:hypothetical protein
MILPITLLVSLFNGHVRIYEIHDNGCWFNLGLSWALEEFWAVADRQHLAIRNRGNTYLWSDAFPRGAVA